MPRRRRHFVPESILPLQQEMPSRCSTVLKSINGTHIFCICLSLLLLVVLLNHSQTRQQLLLEKTYLDHHRRRWEAEMREVNDKFDKKTNELTALTLKYQKCWTDFSKLVDKVESQQIFTDSLQLEITNRNEKIKTLEMDQMKLLQKYMAATAEKEAAQKNKKAPPVPTSKEYQSGAEHQQL